MLSTETLSRPDEAQRQIDIIDEHEIETPEPAPERIVPGPGDFLLGRVSLRGHLIVGPKRHISRIY
jgi:hypothetical protein